MAENCGNCIYGKDRKMDGKRTSPGTVWCAKRSMQMGKSRILPCHKPLPGVKKKHCINCKWAKIKMPRGEMPKAGHVWCAKRHIEIGKQRSMQCFE
ncbi:MAG: hypothetical protein OEV42_18920 [Deltaproteobacteria bacterium]|nr:hypothetical protein [Deltaproteobacteria bacterium]